MNGFGAQTLRDEVFRDELAQFDIVINDENAGGERRCRMVRGHRKHHKTCHHGDGRNRVKEPG